ncbi:MAG: hypothetical protein JNJ71_04440 [Rubrivivax sp.]|nr:hypothetical protein [Rubrivivax sp.]
MVRFRQLAFLGAVPLLMMGCALRSADVAPLRADPQEFAGWACERIDDEADHVQRQAARVAYAFDERAGGNVVALGLGLTVFWPVLLTMRPQGPDATVLAALKGRHEALQEARRSKSCPGQPGSLPARWAAQLPVAVGDRLVYEQRATPRSEPLRVALRVADIRRDEIELAPWSERTPPTEPASPASLWLNDLSGNLKQAPLPPVWPALLREQLELGRVVSGELRDPGDARQWARVRGQVVAVGPQSLAGQEFNVAVVELFGDAHQGDTSARLDGVLVLDRGSGLTLRLDLFSSVSAFNLQRRLVRLERVARAPPAAP